MGVARLSPAALRPSSQPSSGGFGFFGVCWLLVFGALFLGVWGFGMEVPLSVFFFLGLWNPQVELL